MEDRKEKIIVVKIPYDIYIRLQERCRVEGYSLLSDYVRSIIYRELGIETTPSRIERIERRIDELEEKFRDIDVDRIASRLVRRIHDMVNPISAELSKLSNRLAGVVERIDGLEERVNKVEQSVARLVETRGVPRKRGIDRLREQGVLFESELKRLRDRDRFFAYLEREGAKVIEAVDERVAVYPDFWEGFKQKLFNEVTTNNEEEIKNMLSDVEYKLFKKLVKSGLIYYNSIEKKWMPTSKELID